MKTRYFLFGPELKSNPEAALRKCCNKGWSWYSCYTHKWLINYGYKKDCINIPEVYKEITEEEAFRYILEH